MDFKHARKRVAAGALAAIMVTTALPVSVFAETYKVIDPKTGKETIQTTDWNLTEDNLKEKNYWPLANGQYLREVSNLAEPLRNPMIGYGGYFIRPDGRTVMRLTMRKFDKVGSGVWHVMQLKLEDSFYDMVDWNDTETGIYKGVSAGSTLGWYHDDKTYDTITPFGVTNITNAGTTNVKEVNIAQNGNTGTTGAMNEVPINLVLKEGQTVEKFAKEPLVQMRLMTDDRKEIACYTDKATGRGNYSTYTFASIVPVKHNYEQNLLREIRYSVTPDRFFRGGGSSVYFNKEKGYIEVRHRYNKVGSAKDTIDGREMGYRQVVDKRFFDVLEPIDASGTIAHIYSTANNGNPSPGRLDNEGKPKPDGSVAVLRENINFPEGSDVGFIQIANNAFDRTQEAQEGIKTNLTTNQPLASWFDGLESLINGGQSTIVRYYVNPEKVEKLLNGNDGLQYFPFYSAVITDNKAGQYKYTFKLDKDVTIRGGEKIKIDFADKFGSGILPNAAAARNREMRLGIRGQGTEMFLGSNFLHAGQGQFYEYTVQKGMDMTLKAGTELYLFANYKDGGEATLHFKDLPEVYKANYVEDHSPIVMDWQGTYSAGTVTTTYQKPDVDEIFIGDTKISGRTAYENAQIDIKKSKEDTKGQNITAKPGDTSNKDDSRIDVKVNGVVQKGYEFDTEMPGKDKTFTMPTLERDMPLLFSNTDVETLAGESRPPVVEQVQAKVTFDLNGVTSTDNKAKIEKIAPLSAEYKYDIETGKPNANYKPSGFEGDNLKKDAQGNLLDHDGNPLKGDALKLRQMPTKDAIRLPQGKKLLGWTTVKLAEKDGQSVAEQFNALKDSGKVVTKASDWTKAEKEAYVFDANSPIDTNRTVYAVYGEGINLILHSNNTTDPKDEQTITVPITIADVDKTNKIIDAVSSATLNHSKDKLIIKQLPKVPVTGEQEEIEKITDVKAKTFNIPQNSFIGWTTKRYTNGEDSEFAAGNNNERIGEITKGLVANGTKRIPQKTEWLKDLNTQQNKYYIPNGYSVAIRPQDVNRAYDDLKTAIEEGKDIHLYANYRPFFTINVVASYKNIDAAQGKHGKYVDTVDTAKKKAAKIGLLRRTAVTNYGTPTVHQNANYYPLGDAGLKEWDGTDKTLTWKMPGFDELGQRMSYVSAVVPADKVEAYKNFKVPNWGDLGLKTYLRLQGSAATVDPNAPKNLHENAGNPYGDPLAKNQAYSIGVDAFTSATSRKAQTVDRVGTDEVTGYTIWNTSTPVDIPKPAFSNVYDTDKEAKLTWGEAEKNAGIKAIKLTVADGTEVVLAKQQDGSYSGGGLTAKEDNGKLVIGTLDLKGKENQDIVAKYVVEKAGTDLEGQEGRVTINQRGTSAPVERMKQVPNQDGKPVVEFDIPNPTLNKPTPGTEYVAQKWDKDNNKWVDAGKTTMENTDTLGQTKTITLEGVNDGDIVRIVSKQPDMLPSASNKDGDNAIGDTDVVGRNYVKIDAAGPEINPAKATDEKFRRFIDLTAVLSEIPEGRKVHVKVTYQGMTETNEFDYEVTKDETTIKADLLNTILRQAVNEGKDPTITITAVDEFGNETVKTVDYEKTYQLLVKFNGQRAGRKFMKVTADRDNSNVTIKVLGADGTDKNADVTVNVPTKGTFVKAIFGNGYKLQSGDVLVISGTCQEGQGQDAKTYVTNPYKYLIK